ncbi:GntR family transcriptional regulator [Paratractidigestivibacter faecalis]|uniref:GntR family transcriptional regulator n=1 Tax=Paratractidigestivibacter faecalis TaxID=2292441 RepID=UPI0026F12E5B|nr:GntR family transcriptional regulator [Paratractidigestivibacter faecalis]MDD6417532.1 GntR family transcriptional regulator [Paratractidigestivibacter faecalis]
MVITVDKLSDAPLYLQLRDAVIAGIASGELRPGDALPSVRSLAEDLGINLHTVNKAYATLRDEGYVIMLGRRGAYVADAPADPAAGMDEAALEAALTKLATEFKASGGTRHAFLAAAKRAARNLD